MLLSDAGGGQTKAGVGLVIDAVLPTKEVHSGGGKGETKN